MIPLIQADYEVGNSVSTQEVGGNMSPLKAVDTIGNYSFIYFHKTFLGDE